jgi:hypothetical protein
LVVLRLITTKTDQKPQRPAGVSLSPQVKIVQTSVVKMTTQGQKEACDFASVALINKKKPSHSTLKKDWVGSGLTNKLTNPRKQALNGVVIRFNSYLAKLTPN